MDSIIEHLHCIKDIERRTWIEDFYNAVEICDGWDELKKDYVNIYDADILKDINLNLEVNYYSIQSYDWTLQNIIYIAKFGMKSWLRFRNEMNT